MTTMLDALFNSASIAIVGASPNNRTIRYLNEYKYRGNVVLVNPRHDNIGGKPCFPTIESAAQKVDQALLAVPARALQGAIGDAGRSGVKVVNVLAAGFAESSSHGHDLQGALAGAAGDFGMRLLGPNCLGVVNTHLGLMATSSSAFENLRLPSGSVSIVSQSGAVGVYLASLLATRHIGIHYFASTGNEADIQAGECLRYIVEDDSTDVVVLYIEGIRDGEAFIRALYRAHQLGKRVIAIKAGRSEASTRAVLSHTASIAGDDLVYDAMLERMGVYRAESLSHAVDAVEALMPHDPTKPTIHRVGVVSISGGMGALAAEQLQEAGFDVPQMPSNIQERMKEVIPYCSPQNPIDTSGQISREPVKFRRFLELLVESDTVDAILIILAYLGHSPTINQQLRPDLETIAANVDLPLGLVANFTEEDAAWMRHAGYATSTDTPEFVRRLSLLRSLQRLAAADVPDPSKRPAALQKQPSREHSSTSDVEFLSDIEALQLIESVGVVVPQWLHATVEQDVAERGKELGFPVVVKGIVKGVIHKSDHGLVATNLLDAQSMRSAIADMRHVNPSMTDILLQRMVDDTHRELIISAWRDSVFGPMFLVGAGGTMVEAKKDRAIIVPPITADAVHKALAKLDIFPLLEGARGTSRADFAGIQQALRRLEALLDEHPEVIEIEVNPLLVGDSDQGVVAVDAVIRTQR